MFSVATRCFRRIRGPAALVPLAALAVLWLGGCQMPSPSPPAPDELRQAAVAVLTDVLESSPLPQAEASPIRAPHEEALAQGQLQAQALEAVAEFPDVLQSQWLARALTPRPPLPRPDNSSDGVRYAALLAVGKLADAQQGRLAMPYIARVREYLNDENDFLKLAAGFALYKLTGEAKSVEKAAAYLARRGPDPKEDKRLAPLRSQTIYVLSLMPQLKPQRMIERMLKDPDSSVQVMAQVRLAALGDSDALGQVINMAQSPHPDDALDALQVLGEIRLADLRPLQRCLAEVPFKPGQGVEVPPNPPEVRMAAARALGLHGDPGGLDLALNWLDYQAPRKEKLNAADAQQDPLREYRVRFLAALALGAIGDYDRSAGPLLNVLRTSPSRRFKVTAARGALELLARSGRWQPRK